MNSINSITFIFMVSSFAMQAMDKSIVPFNHKNREEQSLFGKPLEPLSLDVSEKSSVLLQKLFEACQEMHSLSIKKTNVPQESFHKIKNLLDIAEPIQDEHLHSLCFPDNYKIIPNSRENYAVDVSLFHVLVLSFTNAFQEKVDAIEAFCNRFEENGYKLFYLKDSGKTQLIHKIFEKGDAAAVDAALRVVQSCDAKIQNKKGGASGKVTGSHLIKYFFTHRSKTSQDTPLHKAAYFNNISAITEFLRSISPTLADFLVNQSNRKNHTPIDVAKEKMDKDSSYKEIYELLLSYKSV